MAHRQHVFPSTRNRRPGQVVFEFVLMLPVFFAVVLLAVDFGMLMYQYVSVANAVREGARFGAVICFNGCTTDEIKQRTLDRSGGVLSDAGQVTVEYCDRATTNPLSEPWPHRGDSVQVSVNHPYTFLFVPWSPQIPVLANAEMLIESTDPPSNLGLGMSC